MKQYGLKAASLKDVLDQYSFGKTAAAKTAGETITHKSVLDQTNLGKEQQKEQVANTPGMQASDPANAQTEKLGPTSEPGGIQDNVTDGQTALKATGTTVNTMAEDGSKASLNQVKSAAIRHELAQVIAIAKRANAAPAAPAAPAVQTAPAAAPAVPVQKQAAAPAPAAAPAQAPAPVVQTPLAKLASMIAQRKQANAVAQQAAAPAQPAVPQIMTGTAVFNKIASLGENPTEAQQREVFADMQKLATTNPVFAVCFEQARLRKMAEDAMALAESQGISPEDAAQALDAAISQDPAAAEELDNEAAGAAVSDLAEGEAQTQQLMDAANGASEQLGVEVTPEDLLSAADDVAAAAEQMGVPPEALVQEALNQMMSEGGEAQVTPEDEAQAQAILDQAAAAGISPEEVLQEAVPLVQEQPAAQPAEGQPAAEPAPAASAPADQAPAAPAEDTKPPVEKAASLQKLSGSIRGKLALAALAGKRK